LAHHEHARETVSAESLSHALQCRLAAGQQLASRGYQSCVLLGITPEGVEIAAHAAKAMGAQFDVIVASFIKLGANLAPIGRWPNRRPRRWIPTSSRG